MGWVSLLQNWIVLAVLIPKPKKLTEIEIGQ